MQNAEKSELIFFLLVALKWDTESVQLPEKRKNSGSDAEPLISLFNWQFKDNFAKVESSSLPLKTKACTRGRKEQNLLQFISEIQYHSQLQLTNSKSN